MEDPILRGLLKRSSLPYSEHMYIPLELSITKNKLSPLGLHLLERELADAATGRYEQPAERAFFARIKQSISLCQRLRNDRYDKFNVTKKILTNYYHFISALCHTGINTTNNEITRLDVDILQMLSKRIHFAAFFAGEAKYHLAPILITQLTATKQIKALFRTITRRTIELQTLDRVRKKLIFACQQYKPTDAGYHITEVITEFFRNTVIRLSKEAQVCYLLFRSKADNFC